MRHRQNFNDPGDAHELTFSCFQRFAFLKAQRVCQWLKEAIDQARVKLDFSLWAYVIMPEHVHLIVCPRQPVYDVADIRRAIKEPVARKGIEYLSLHASHWLPRVTRKRGHRTERCFWQSGGGYDRNIKSGKTLLVMIDYLHLNPVRRGLVEKAVNWKWSSASWYELSRPGPIEIDPIPPAWLMMERSFDR
jgi:putative transposase